MKAKYLYAGAALMLTLSLSSCRDEHLMTDGEGTLRLSATVNSDVEIISRATLSPEETEALAAATVVRIYNAKGIVHEYIGAENVPSAVRLVSGNYNAEAWTGDSVPASWDKTFYKSGFVNFDITNGTTTPVELTCRVANTLASVNYTDATLDVLENPVMTVSLEDGITDGSHSLTFDGVTADKGRFMINTRTKGLRWTLTGTQADGSDFTKTGLIENIKAATEYVLNVKYVGSDIAIGGAYFEIEVEEEPVGDDTEIKIVLPPSFTGLLGFDDDNTFRGQPHAIGRKSIFISAAAELTDVEVTCADLTSIVGSDRIDLLHITDAPRQQLKDAGVNWLYTYDQAEDLATLRLNMEDEFLYTFEEGTHTIDIVATDANGKTSKAQFTIIVSAAPVTIPQNAVTNVTYTSASIKGQILKVDGNVNEYGFMVRKASVSRSYEEWTKVPATVNGTELVTDLTDLTIGATYEYKVYADDFETDEVMTFTTTDLQLANAGFEDWSLTGKVTFPGLDYNQPGWDTGNHGSMTMSKLVTDKDASVKHSGNYSAKLSSQFVGIGTIGKFAAGNVFYGKYLATDGTDGVLGWGNPWPNYVPKALKVWVKYNPATIDNKASDAPAEYVKGEMDRGIIYVAFLTDEMLDPSTSDVYPVVIKTKASVRQLFDKNGSNVVAYGEKVFTQADAPDQMVEFEIPINEVHGGTVSYVMVTCSASKGGDYFTGGNGSTMWVDDLKFIY
ncbi:MAG: DUF4493 domain-containing protein [Lachnoclostridium sp.]|nr:DUF4493 domain-containing protein [Lachnoclostridium sp.]